MYDELVKMLRICAEADSCTDCPYLYGGDCGGKAKRAADAIEALSAKVPQWISVEEQLPEEGRNVLATFDDVVLVAFYGNYTWAESATFSVFYPTHWMPLPEPPEREVEA